MKNIEYVYIFIIGFGYCLLYVFFYIMFGLYYDKYRSLVMGVVIVGLGFGGIVFFNLVQYFIDEYGWRGLFFVVVGINLNVFVFFVLF